MNRATILAIFCVIGVIICVGLGFGVRYVYIDYKNADSVNPKESPGCPTYICRGPSEVGGTNYYPYRTQAGTIVFNDPKIGDLRTTV